MNKALKFLNDQLTAYLKINSGLNENMVTVGRIVEQDGTIPMKNRNKLVLSFVSLSQETSMRPNYSRMGFAADGANIQQGALNFTINVVLASLFDEEQESLKFLSKAAEFFHNNLYFDKTEHPELPAEIAKINLEMCNLSLQEVDALWSGIGAKAVPSILYKVRVTSINTTSVDNDTPSISSGQP
jgi:hypothetical protein